MMMMMVITIIIIDKDDFVAVSYLSMSPTCAASAAEAAAQRMIDKYEDTSLHHLFFPFAIEAMAQ